eukprot:CAMPEP_0206027194 /NCGR_PEP_ID=MMETSP1464-20131121/42922_1 /ASSEMBLY_ACC=CAM_ASM_001124 /TAXON_ID=119497 /ORGANISM="Exanthemachrysis gayraliae, Strain RCC1523" /LENGTH=119 /DNA_ID=CAMNT_0053401235 /DNA_START=17 /DNA_END=372 /DNA_ORIENTATION=-
MSRVMPAHATQTQTNRPGYVVTDTHMHRHSQDAAMSRDPCWSSSPPPACNVHSPKVLDECFPDSFVARLKGLVHEYPGSTCSKNMYATRHFFRDAQLAAEIRDFLPPALGITHVLSDMR